MALGEDAQTFGILFDTAGKALIGEVKQRQPAGSSTLLGQCAPLISGRVDTGRVVAAAVQQHQIACLHFSQRGLHGGKVETLAGRIVVLVPLDGKASSLEHADVVGPGGIGDPDSLGQTVAHHELGGDAQGTGTARRLSSLGPAAGDQRRIVPEQQLLHDAAIFDIAFDTEVILGLLVGQELLLGFLDAVENGGGTGLILVDPDPQVDLVAARVSTEGFGQAQDRIRWGGNNLFKHGIPCIPLSSLAGKACWHTVRDTQNTWQTKAPIWRALRQLFISPCRVGANRFFGRICGNLNRWHATAAPTRTPRQTSHHWTQPSRYKLLTMTWGSGSAPRDGNRSAAGHRPP